MFLSLKYHKFSKLAQLNSFIGLSFKNKEHNKKLKFKVFLYYNAYVFYDFFALLLFLYKIRIIFKKFFFLNGRLCVVNKHIALQKILKSTTKKTFFFYLPFDKPLFNNANFFKYFISAKNKIDIDNINSFRLTSFLIILLEKCNRLEKQKIKNLYEYNIPTLYLSDQLFYNSYWIPTSLDLKKSYFWFFLIFQIVMEELVFTADD